MPCRALSNSRETICIPLVISRSLAINQRPSAGSPIWQSVRRNEPRTREHGGDGRAGAHHNSVAVLEPERLQRKSGGRQRNARAQPGRRGRPRDARGQQKARAAGRRRHPKTRARLCIKHRHQISAIYSPKITWCFARCFLGKLEQQLVLLMLSPQTRRAYPSVITSRMRG